MEHIVKSEVTPARWQVAADATAVVAAIILLAALGVFAAVKVGSTISFVIAALVGLSALVFIPAVYALATRPQI